MIKGDETTWIVDRRRRDRGSRFFLFYTSTKVQNVVSVKSERVLACARMRDGEDFTLSFVHSVNKRPVYDTLRVEGDQLRIVKSRFDSFGAGMPETSTGGMRLQIGEDGWLEWLVDRPVPEVTFFVGWVANHSLRIRNRQIPLKELADPGTLVALRVRAVSPFQLWKGRCMP